MTESEILSSGSAALLETLPRNNLLLIVGEVAWQTIRKVGARYWC